MQTELIQTDLSTFPRWRRLMHDEEFAYNYLPHAGNKRGYAVTTVVLLFGHENCGCWRCRNPERVTWFLPHSEPQHGRYPMPVRSQEFWYRILMEQLLSIRPGFILHKGPLSYGALRDDRDDLEAALRTLIGLEELRRAELEIYGTALSQQFLL